jgi:hypothetical protein
LEGPLAGGGDETGNFGETGIVGRKRREVGFRGHSASPSSMVMIALGSTFQMD